MILTRDAEPVRYFPAMDLSGDALGWLLAIGFALVFAVVAGAVAYQWSRANY